MINDLNSVIRTENKYLMYEQERYLLQKYFSQVLHEDSHNKTKGYMVRSLYFDTSNFSDYYDKLDGLEERRKIRLRMYDANDQFAKLELKEKSGSNQRKRSLTLNREQAISISKGDYTPLLSMDNSFALELYSIMVCNIYRPCCIVVYRRYAYILPENEIRITFDSDVRSSMSPYGFFEDNFVGCPILPFGNVIMEVKFNHFLLSYIKEVIGRYDYMATAVSKYCMARVAGNFD